MTASRNDILVVEQTAMVGSIIVSTARELKLPNVRLATSVRVAQQFLEQHSFSGLIASLNDEAPALEMIQSLRAGQYRTSANIPVAVTATECGVDLANTLRGFLVRRVLLKPFKVRDVVLTIRMLQDSPQETRALGPA
jgi:CheY-like chemotaxis protein